MTIKTLFFGLCMLAFGMQINAQTKIGLEKKAEKAAELTMQTGPDVVDVAASNKDFSTLVAAIKAAGLVDVLKTGKAFTIFAPTNAAFEKLEAGTVESLLMPESKEKLQAILKYHVVVGKFKAKDIVDAINSNGGEFTVETLAGGKLKATLEGDAVLLTDDNGRTVQVSKADIGASNGVIHVVDSVCLPL